MSTTWMTFSARVAACLTSLSLGAMLLTGCDGSSEPAASLPSASSSPAMAPAAESAGDHETAHMSATVEARSAPGSSAPRPASEADGAQISSAGPSDEAVSDDRAAATATQSSAAAARRERAVERRPATMDPIDVHADGSVLGTASTAQSASRTTEPPPSETTEVAIRMEPAIVDFGDIATGDAGIGTVRLTNVGSEPRVLLDCRTSCGCTTTNCDRNRVLEPGEYVDVEVKLDGGQRPQLLTKTVTFLFSEHAPMRLTVRGNAVAFVTVEPEILDARQHPDGRVVLRSVDGQPFRIRSMFPPVLEDLPAEAKVEHELIFSYEQFRDEGFRQRRILVRLDHPKCDRVTISLAPNVLAPASAQGARPQPSTVTRNASLARLDTLLSGGQEDAAIEMLESGEFNLEDTDSDQQTPLIKASRWGKPRLIQALLDQGADMSAADRLGRTPIVYAAQSKNLEAVRLLIAAGADIMRADDLGNTPIGWAAGFGTVEIVRELIDHGAAIDSAGGTLGFTPLIWAAGFGDASVVELLLDNGASVGRADVLEGMTALMHAVRTNRHASARLLIERGAQLEDKNKEGSTAFLVAARNAGADAEMVRLIVAAGANVDVKDERGRSAIELAIARTDLRAEEVAAAVREAMRAPR